MDRLELAWAAGFWDGEGSAWLTRAEGRANWQPQARINQSSTTGVPKVLERFGAALGIGRLQGPEIDEGREPLYRWVVSSRDDVGATYRSLRPWLGMVKRRQFRNALGAFEDETREEITDRDEQRAWAAGLFDGEGWTCLSKHRSHSGYRVIEAGITQASWDGLPETLARYLDLVRVGKIYGPYSAGDGHAPIYRWKTYRIDEIYRTIELLRPWLGDVKTRQADGAIEVMNAQPPLPRGNPAWGNRKTHCVNGHEYATARLRPFRGRGKNTDAPRASHQCLACVRDSARRKRRERKQKSRGLSAAPVSG